MACKNGGDTYGDYDSIAAAKIACDADANCGKVCDKYCDEQVITLCVKGTEELVSDQLVSCLYIHDRNGYTCTTSADCANEEYCNDHDDDTNTPSICAGLTSVQQDLNTLTAESCDALALDQIKDALATILDIAAEKIHLECPTQRVRGKAHIILTVDTDDDETRRGVFATMSNIDVFVEMLNNKLPGTANDFSDGSIPSVNTQATDISVGNEKFLRTANRNSRGGSGWFGF